LQFQTIEVFKLLTIFQAHLTSPPSVTQSAEEPTALSAAGAVVEPRRPAPNGVTSWSDMWQKQGTVAPGSWLPLPSSFEQSGARPDQDVAQVEGEAEVDRQFLDKIRTIHNFGDTEESSQPSGRMFQPSKHREAPIEDDMVQQLFHTHEADALLNEYRQMSASFPFIIVPSDMDAQRLYHAKPMLCLAIFTATSWQNHQRQRKLDAIYRKELAHRTIISPKRTLGLVQSVLVYLSWYVKLSSQYHGSPKVGITLSSVIRRNRYSSCIIS
jgi:hypothetical protein